MFLPSPDLSRPTGIRSRMGAMVPAWLVLGAAVGMHTGFRLPGGALAVFSHAIAGMVVFGVMGAILAVFTSRAKESLMGGAFGMLVGLLAGPRGATLPPGEATCLCLVISDLTGATCWPLVHGVIRLAATVRLVGGHRFGSREGRGRLGEGVGPGS